MITKKLFSMTLALMFVMAGAMMIGSVIKIDNGNGGYYSVEAANTTKTVYQNVSDQINALVPSFFLLVFVMCFMLILLTIVDRMKK